MKPPNHAALERAIDAVGGQVALARLIGTTQSNVWYWLERSKHGVPAEWVAKVAAATKVAAHELRPDIYPPSGRGRAA